MKIIAILFCLCASACGVSTPGGYVLGTTSYLHEWNAGRGANLDQLTNSDREQLSEELNRRN